MSRRSTRVKDASAKQTVPQNISDGFTSMVCNPDTARIVRGMLDDSLPADASSSPQVLVDGLLGVMRVNQLTAEMVLARFFPKAVLSSYSERLGRSGNGGEAILAERIVKVWNMSSTFSMPAAATEPKKTKGRRRRASAPGATDAAAAASSVKRGKLSAPAKKKVDWEAALVNALGSLVALAAANELPVQVEGLWLCVVDKKKMGANLIPLVAPGNTETAE